MKLYLSSYKIGTKTSELKKWIDIHGNKIVIIANAKDQYTDLKRVENGTMDDISQLEAIDFKVQRLNLKDYFGKKDKLRADFQEIKAFYVVGGNTFVLRRAMKLSGFDILLKEFSLRSNILYAGYSAGICVLAPNMRAIAVMDEPEINPYNTDSHPIYEGIGLIAYSPIPHFESVHSETEAANHAVDYCIKNDIIYKTLCDGDVIIEDTNNTI